MFVKVSLYAFPVCTRVFSVCVTVTETSPAGGAGGDVDGAV